MSDAPAVVALAMPADVPALAACAATAFREAYAPTHAAERIDRYVADHFTEAAWAGILARGERVWVARRDGAIVGYVQARPAAPPRTVAAPSVAPLEVARLYVRQGARGGGIGRRLLDAAHAHAAAAGHDLVWLAVWRHNHPAIRFYRRAGLVEVGTTTFDFAGVIEEDLVFAGPPRP